MKQFITSICLLFISYNLLAQLCSAPGQLPASAFPVCGTTTFHQTNVPICSTHTITVPGCANDGASYADKNPYWYKFTCYSSGSLGFLIVPNNQGDDYDWMLYDITGHTPNAVFTDPGLIVTGNWAGTYGNTGASPSGVNFIQCASDPKDNKNSFSTMPQLIAGHTYLLLVSHYTDSQSGYDLSFGGGTAVITDPKIPALATAQASCGGDIIYVKLNKHIKCSTIAANGSDFYITPGNPFITSAIGIGCSTGFDTDSLEVHLGTFLAPGNYSLNMQLGNDGNTLLDYCDNAVPVNAKTDFIVSPRIPTPMDSLEAVKCSPRQLRLVFRKSILCSSVAANGSDFALSGPYAVAISGASGGCTGTSDITKQIIITLAKPLQQQGNFKLTLQTGSDGNTLFDECGSQTSAGSFLQFSVKDTVDADFTYLRNYNCSVDTIDFIHGGGNGVNSWQWNLDENQSSALQNPLAYYHVFTQKNISLVVSNGFCSDTSRQTIQLDNFLKADFSVFDDNCPNEPINFTSQAQGKIMQYQWSFGDGATASAESPVHIYTMPYNTTPFTVSFTVTDSMGCKNTAQKVIKVYSSCYLAVPTAFTPNNDGKNDYLHPLNAIKTEQLDFKVFNRWGQLVYQSNDWKRGWDGSFEGQPQPTGIFVWFLQYVDRDTHQRRTMKGTSLLIR